MTMANRVLDVSEYDVAPLGRRHPLFWGMLGLITVETVVFATLITCYFYLRTGHPEWPPAGIEEPELLLPTLNTLVLLLSSIPMYFADKGIAEGKQWHLRIGVMAASALALVFLVIKGIEYSHLEYDWSSHAYGSIVWTIAGFHSLHVGALLLKTLIVGILAWKGFFHEEERIAVQVNGIYWHFVVLIWIPLYIVLYLVPHWM